MNVVAAALDLIPNILPQMGPNFLSWWWAHTHSAWHPSHWVNVA